MLGGYLAALVATMVWGGNFVVARAFAEAIPPFQLNFWRWFVAFGCILPFAWHKLRTDWPLFQAHFGYLSLMALIGVTFQNTFIYKAGQSTESLNMALIMPATPVAIMLLARIFYGESITTRRLLGMGTAISGILVLISRGNWHKLAGFDFNSGDLWTIAGMLFFAFYSLLIRKRPQAISSLGFNAAVFGLGLCYTIPFALGEALILHGPKLSWGMVIGICYAGLGCSTIAFWLWTISIDRIGPVRSGIVYYSLPIFAALGAYWILGETVVSAQVWGGLAIISGILLATIPGRSLRSSA